MYMTLGRERRRLDLSVARAADSRAIDSGAFDAVKHCVSRVGVSAPLTSNDARSVREARLLCSWARRRWNCRKARLAERICSWRPRCASTSIAGYNGRAKQVARGNAKMRSAQEKLKDAT